MMNMLEKIMQKNEPQKAQGYDNIPSIFLRLGASGGCLNKKDGLTRYGNSHVKDKTS